MLGVTTLGPALAEEKERQHEGQSGGRGKNGV
jgi:hypothetical protein